MPGFMTNSRPPRPKKTRGWDSWPQKVKKSGQGTYGSAKPNGPTPPPQPPPPTTPPPPLHYFTHPPWYGVHMYTSIVSPYCRGRAQIDNNTIASVSNKTQCTKVQAEQVHTVQPSTTPITSYAALCARLQITGTSTPRPHKLDYKSTNIKAYIPLKF